MKRTTMMFLRFIMAALSATAAMHGAELAAGDSLPPLRGEFLTGRAAALPEAAAGRVALILLGFTHDSQTAVEAWAKKFRGDFGSQPGVTFFEVPMIGGMGVMAKWFIDGGMRRGTPKADQENVITVYGSTDEWKRRVGYTEPKAAYLILIDGSGRIVWRNQGNFNEEHYRELSSEVTQLLAKKK